MEKIILVTDRLQMAQPLSTAFALAGYHVESLYQLSKVISTAKEIKPHGIIWDLKTVQLEQALTTIKALRNSIMIPQLLIAETYQASEAIESFNHNVDDYLDSTVPIEEIVVRLQQREKVYQLVNHHEKQEHKLAKYQLGEITIDIEQKQVQRAGKVDPLGLTPKEFKLLVYFLQHRNQVLSREQLIEGVWNDFYISNTSRMLEMHISHLRDKIEVDPANPKLIVTVRGFGYQLVYPSD